jgi:PilZ domain
MTRPDTERRKHPRIRGKAGIRLTAGEHECSVLDISCSGIRFVIDEPPPLMSLVDIQLEIPRAQRPERNGADSMHCRGAVVRAEGTEAGYDVAVFITEIEDNDRLLISDYVRSQSE